MIHDHLCPMVTGKPPFRDDVTDDCLFCPTIAKVREQRIKTHEGCADAERIDGYVDGYAAALDAALKALNLMENMGGYPEFDFDHIRDDFRDVIDSLKEKP